MVRIHLADLQVLLPLSSAVWTYWPKTSMPCHRKNNGFPILDILGYLKNTHKNPKFGRVRQIPIWELGWEFPDWDLSHSPKFGIFVESVIFSCELSAITASLTCVAISVGLMYSEHLLEYGTHSLSMLIRCFKHLRNSSPSKPCNKEWQLFNC